MSVRRTRLSFPTVNRRFRLLSSQHVNGPCPPSQLEISICLRLLGASPPDPHRALPLDPVGGLPPPDPNCTPRRKFLATPLMSDIKIYCNCRREAHRLHADYNCSESGRKFRIYLLENWTDLDKMCQGDGEWGKNDPRSRSHREGAKCQPFFVMNRRTTHPFGHFRFTDFRETWWEYVNPRAGESFRSEILNIFRQGVAFLQKLTFRQLR